MIDLLKVLRSSLYICLEHFHKFQDLLLRFIRLLLEIDCELLIVVFLRVNLLKLKEGILIVELSRN